MALEDGAKSVNENWKWFSQFYTSGDSEGMESVNSSPSKVELNEYFGSVLKQVTDIRVNVPGFASLKSWKRGQLIEQSVALEINSGPYQGYFEYTRGGITDISVVAVLFVRLQNGELQISPA
jgi:hypothetical protein